MGVSLRGELGASQRRGLELSAIYFGVTLSDAVKIGGVELRIIRELALHFKDRGHEGLLNRNTPGAEH
jgi:putative transposase